MGRIHQLVIDHGVADAKLLVAPEDRPLIDIAAQVLTDESGDIGITYSGFCLTALPHRRLNDSAIWERRGHGITLTISPGRLPDGKGATKPHGVPYGARARMILLYLQTRALQKGSPRVELGGSMREWLSRMAIPIGGKTAREVQDQADRLSACHLMFQWDGGQNLGFINSTIISGGLGRIEVPNGHEPEQAALWVDEVCLSETFYRALRDHPVPVSETALRQISGDGPALDAYIWLAYRLHILNRPTPISWAALKDQFGPEYTRLRDFRKRWSRSLAEALAAYPDARVIIDDAGITLYPSAPPVMTRTLSTK